MFAFIVLILIVAPFGMLAMYAISHGVPIVNRILSVVWEDPTVRQRAVIARRLKELHVDGTIPEETAVLLAAKEFNATEDELMRVAGMFNAGDLMGMLTGKRQPMGVLLNGIEKALKRRK